MHRRDRLSSSEAGNVRRRLSVEAITQYKMPYWHSLRRYRKSRKEWSEVVSQLYIISFRADCL